MTTSRTRERSRVRVIFALLSVSAATFAALQSLIAPALPTMQQDLGATQAATSWVLISWLLSASVATPILGRVGDILGKDRTLLIVLGAIALGSLIAAVAPSIGVVIVGRVIQGLGGAVYPVAFGIIRDEFTRERVPAAVGTMSSVIAVGGGIGTVLAGPIVTALGWRWLFGLPLVVVVVAGLLSWRFIPSSPVRTNGSVNWVASVLLGSWLVALLLPVSVGTQWGLASPVSIALLAAAAIVLVVWIWYESRTANPLIDMKLMRRRTVWATNLVAALFGGAMFSVITFLPQFLQTPSSAGYGFGASVTVSGLLILPLLATMAVGGLVSGPISSTVSLRAQLIGGSALLGVGAIGFALWSGTEWQVAVSGALFGLGLGLAYAAMTSLTVQAVAPAQTGVATGINTNVRNIGGAIGTAVFTGVITSTAGPSGHPSAGGYITAFLVVAALAVVGVAAAVAVPRRTSAAEEKAITAPVTVWSAADEDWG